MSTFEEQIAGATDTRDPDQYISQVKAVVTDRLMALDPTMRLEDTQYFNHSAIPDFVASWPGERGARPIYLRDSYESMAAAADVAVLGKTEPVVLALRPDREARDREVESGDQRVLLSRGQVLVTEPDAVDLVTDAGTSDSPLSDLVRANFLRGGKGYVDETRAAALLDMSNKTEQAGDAAAAMGDFFLPDAAARISRTAQLITLAVSTDLGSDGELPPLIGGKLSAAELSHLLPWLLRQSAPISRRFWEHVGSLMSFADLEGMREQIRGLDVSALIAANSRTWEVKRAYVGVSVPIEGADDYEARRNYWSFENGALGIDIGEQRISLAHKGFLLKSRDGLSSTSWASVGSRLQPFRIARVELRGIRRSVVITAEQSDDVSADVEEVTNSLDDTYYLTRVDLRFPRVGADGSTDVQVNFGSEVVLAESGASLLDLTRTAVDVLNPVRQDPVALPIPIRAVLGLEG